MSDCVSCDEKRKVRGGSKIVQRVQEEGHAAMNRVIALPQADRRDDVLARKISAVCRECDERRRASGIDVCGEPVESGEIKVIWEIVRTRGMRCHKGKHDETLLRLGVE
jgi:hypothetical protein